MTDRARALPVREPTRGPATRPLGWALRSSGGRPTPMNESMRSVADIPGDDAEDDLSGISPELVLIDPELARLVRERQVDEASLTSRRSTLRLVEGGSAEPAIVPRAIETAPLLPAAPTAETVTSSVPAPVVEPPREEVVPVAIS